MKAQARDIEVSGTREGEAVVRCVGQVDGKWCHWERSADLKRLPDVAAAEFWEHEHQGMYGNKLT